jgi:hypothetical protein
MKRQLAGVLPDPILHRLAYRDLYWPGQAKKPLALVYGNCQAGPMRRLLASSETLASTYRFLRLPPVHEITETQLRRIWRLLPQVELFVTQPVKTQYRGMPLGTEQLAERLSPSARVINWPVAYYNGLHPFMTYVNVHHDPIATSAPITDYHDLRILWMASRGRWTPAEAVDRFTTLRIDPDWVDRHAWVSVQELWHRESLMPEPKAILSDLLHQPGMRTRLFHTMNHPSNRVLRHLARQVMLHLNVQPVLRDAADEEEFLGHLRAPKEATVLRALGGEPEDVTTSWTTPRGEFSQADVVRAHMAFYAANPAVLLAGTLKHGEIIGKDLAPMWLSRGPAPRVTTRRGPSRTRPSPA